MSRELRGTLAIMAAVLLLCAPVIFADAPTQSTASYLALVFQNIPPTPIPSPPIQTLVLHPIDLKSGYTQDEFRNVTNAEAAATYHDPKVAVAAFVAQGREASWYAEYSSTLYTNSDALVVSSQVYRYTTPDGATAGMDYTIAEDRLDTPGFKPFAMDIPCCAVATFRYTFRQNGINLDRFLMFSRVGRYVTETEAIGVLGLFPISRAAAYGQVAAAYLALVPQTMPAATSPQ